MSVTVKQKNNLPPLRGRLRKMGSKILPHIKGQLSARPTDTFKAQKVRGEDVQIVLKFLQDSFDLAPMTTPADTVCKLRLKMSNTDNKIKWMKEQLMDHDVLLLGVQEELDLGPEVNAVRTARAFKKYIRTSKEHTAHLEKTIKDNEALLKTCKEIAGVSGHHTPDGLANFFRSTWSRQHHVISQLKNNIQDLAREMDVDTSSSHISTIVADMTGKFMAMKNDVTSLNDMVKVKKEEIRTVQDSEKTKTNRIVELENELDNLKTRNNYLTLDLKQAQEERKSATNLVSDLEHKLRDLQIDDRKALEIEGLLQRYEEAGKVATNLQSELDDTKQLNQFLNLQIKALDNAKENDAADWEQQKKDLESKLENLEEEIENLNQTNEKLRKEAKSVESQNDGLFEELEKNMELCQALEDEFDVLHQENFDFQSLADSLAEANYNLSAEIGQAYKNMHALEDKLTSKEEEGEKQQELANMLKEENNTLSTSLTSIRSRCKNLEEEIENLNQTNEKLRKEAKSVESQDDRLFEELEKNMELCQDLEDKVATAAREKAEFEQETSRWENEKSELLKQLQNVQKQYQILKDQFNSVTQDGEHRHKLASKLIEEKEELCTQLEEKRQQCEEGDARLIFIHAAAEKLSQKIADIQSERKELQEKLEFAEKERVAYVDRAVFDQIYSDKELTIIKAEDLSCVTDADVDEEDDLIGNGAFGKVFLRQYQGEAVAVKVPYISDGVRDDDDEKRLVRIKADHARTTMEAQVHLAFADLPSFPKTIGIVDFEGAPSLVLEFLGDKKTGTTYSLGQAIKFQIPVLSKSNWFDIIMDIINGMKVMHEKGLLHNDLKSNNILLQWDPDDQRWHTFNINMGKGSTQIIPLRHNKVPKEEIQGYKDGILFQHLAPEYILVLQPMTVQTDIYSLGKLLGRIEEVVKSRALRDLVAEMTSVKPRLRPPWKHIERVIAKAQKRNLS